MHLLMVAEVVVDVVVVGAVAEVVAEAVVVMDTKAEVVDIKVEVVVEVAEMGAVEVVVEVVAGVVLTSIMGSTSPTLHAISVVMNGIDCLMQECYLTSTDSASMLMLVAPHQDKLPVLVCNLLLLLPFFSKMLLQLLQLLLQDEDHRMV